MAVTANNAASSSNEYDRPLGLAFTGVFFVVVAAGFMAAFLAN